MCYRDKTLSRADILTVPDGYIADYIDGTFRKYTPEEYVRQNIEKRLINEHKYLPEQVTVETPIKVGSSRKRVDLAVYLDKKERKQENIHIIIECKKEDVESSSKTEGVEQLKSYMASCLNCEWGLWTNGKTKFVYRKIQDKFEEVNDIPSKDRDISEIDRPKREHLKLATEDNLLFSFQICHNHIYANDGFQKSQAFFEFLKVIFCKILDERNIPTPLEFYTSSAEKNSSDGRLTVKNRIGKIFAKVKKEYPNIFERNDEIKLSSTSLAYIVGELQRYSLLDTYIDVKGKAYETIVGSNLRGDRGEFFTPRNIQRMAVKMLEMSMDEKVLDPACGTGGFLVIAMNNVIKRLETEFESEIGKPRDGWTDRQKERFRDKIKEIASRNFFGFDINLDLVKASKMNMVMNNDGSGNILQNDSLKPPHEWRSEIKDILCKHFDLPKGSIRQWQDLALFDVVLTNPPFGTKIPIKDQNVLSQFDLGHIWKNDDTGKIYKTDNIVTSRAPEVLFIERCWQFLKPGGRMGIVVPNAILSAPGVEYTSIRQWIIHNCKVLASVQLHPDTFQPRNGTQTSVLFVQKKTLEEIEKEKSKGIPDYHIFFAVANKIGHDKRGNPIYKRDEDGNELLLPDERLVELSSDARNNIIKSQIPKTKVLDDNTRSVAELFLKWKEKEGIKW